MAHYTLTSPSPHPANPARTMTLHGNTDCPRCGADLKDVYSEPDDMLHCPKCKGAVVNCARMEDGGEVRTADIHVFAWFAPIDDFEHAGPCDCAGCESRRTGEG